MRAAWFALLAACSFPTKNLVTGDALGSGSGNGDGAVGHTLFVIGGGEGNWGQTDHPNASIPDVISAPINADGSLGAWSTLPPLPQAYVHTNPAVIAGTDAYILGAFGTPDSVVMKTVLFADLTGYSMWTMTADLMFAEGGYESSYGAATDGTSIVVVNSNGTSTWQTKVIAGGGIEPWTVAPDLPMTLSSTAAVYSGGKVYVLGENTAGMLAVVSASLDSTGVGTWVDSGVTTASVGYVVSAAVWQSHLYVVGGFDGNNTGMVNVSMSTIASGTPSAFAAQASLPMGRGNACVVAASNAIYVIGGEFGGGQVTAYDTVYYALPAPDGAIGSWKTATPLPSLRSGVSCVIL